MPTYKKIIFVKAISVRIEGGEGTAEEIIRSYTKLTETEKLELLKEFKK